MHRIDGPTATPDNKFTEGDPTIPVAATTVTADWLNAVQEELCAVIASAELSLDKADNAQLLQALHKILDIRVPLATLLQAGLMRPDGVTTQVDDAGLLSVLGGNLLLNSEEWITTSGTWIASTAGWYEIFLINGGQGPIINVQDSFIKAGASGKYDIITVYLEAQQEVPVTIGAGGNASIQNTGGIVWQPSGGTTSFGGHSPRFATSQAGSCIYGSIGFVVGAGLGGADGNSNPGFYGAGGGVYFNKSGGTKNAKNGAQGAVRVRWHDPAKAAGPVPTPALLSARRMALRAAAAPVTVNLYDPTTGQGSVWREEDAEAKLAEGMITEEAWQEICATKAAEDYATWLADPETEAERFELLRLACEARLTATDKLTTSDYPINDEDRAAVNAYRKAIRELNHRPGAPWDGGGDATPWPEEPTVTKVQEA